MLGSFCQDGDFWLVTATGGGGFTIILTESESPNCGFDPDAFPIIDGGSSSGTSPGPTLVSVGGPFTVDEGSFKDVDFILTQTLSTDLMLRFNRAFQTAGQADISSFEFKTSAQTVFSQLTDGSDIVIPAGVTEFTVRAHIVADATTEGNEIFTIILKEPVLKTKLENATPLIIPVTVVDTSITPGSGAPTSLITVTPTAINVNEGSSAVVTYQLTEPVDSDVQILFKRTLQTASSGDIVDYEYAVGNASGWSYISTNNAFVLPANTTDFYIRINAQADLSTEGIETLIISCEENVVGGVRKLAQLTPVTKQVTINDTSQAPTTFPENPPPPSGFTGGESYSFEVNPNDQFQLDETNGSTTIQWQP